jgi:hypothetical protein
MSLNFPSDSVVFLLDLLLHTEDRGYMFLRRYHSEDYGAQPYVIYRGEMYLYLFMVYFAGTL